MVAKLIPLVSRLCLLVLLTVSIHIVYAQNIGDAYVDKNQLGINFYDWVTDAQIDELCAEYSWCNLTKIADIGITLYFQGKSIPFYFDHTIVENELGELPYDASHAWLWHPFLRSLYDHDIVSSVEGGYIRRYGMLGISCYDVTDTGFDYGLCEIFSWCNLTIIPRGTASNIKNFSFDEDAVADHFGYSFFLLSQLEDFSFVRVASFSMLVGVSDYNDTILKSQQYSIVYPNPSRGENISVKSNIVGYNNELSVFNVKGQLISKTSEYQTQNGESTILLARKNELPSGVYFYHVKSENGTATGKFLILK